MVLVSGSPTLTGSSDWGVIGDRDQLVDTIFVAGSVVRRTRSSAAMRRRTFNKARSVGLTMRHLGVCVSDT